MTEEQKAKARERQRRYRENNRQKIRELSKKYYQQNREIVCANSRARYYRNHESEIMRARKYYHSHKKEHREWIKKVSSERRRRWRANDTAARRSDPKRTMHHRMSTAINISLRHCKNNRGWEDIVGYTVHDLMDNLEDKFTDGMSWDNYGEWHIDHVIPKRFFVFDSENDVEFKMCWRLGNLQPLWAKDNLRKSGKLQYVA